MLDLTFLYNIATPHTWFVIPSPTWFDGSLQTW